MMSRLTRGQKLIAYGSLTFVLAWTLFGIFAILLMTSEG
ncbi:hypothetical protein MNBD_GAMMA26-1791 [hydrothermal vent metagenome]|uniref:Uncharacterized protein n=1 Tax=hydrothermal vent metagenome TaxID=652676 RepID=A0A3B1BHR5_9ZZZZ